MKPIHLYIVGLIVLAVVLAGCDAESPTINETPPEIQFTPTFRKEFATCAKYGTRSVTMPIYQFSGTGQFLGKRYKATTMETCVLWEQ